LVQKWSRAAHLPLDATEEAQLHAALGLLTAIAHYRGSARPGETNCGFRTFLHKVLHDGFRDFRKHYARTERHQDRSRTATELLEAEPNPRRAHPFGSGAESSDAP